MIAFLAVLVGYVALTVECWRRAFSEARRVLPVVWDIVDVMEAPEDAVRDVRLHLPDAYKQARELARDDSMPMWPLVLGAIFAFAVRRPFFGPSWIASRRYRREIVCRLTLVAAMLDYDWDRDDEAAVIANLNMAAHELEHMLDATDRMRGAT